MDMSMAKKLIIAIDGPAGSGKSSTAKALAKRLGLPYIDTGAMYRALTLEAMRKKIPFDDVKGLVKIAKNARIRFVKPPLAGARARRAGTSPAPAQKVYLNGKNVTDAIRTPELTRNVFYIAQIPAIRREMVKKQRQMGQRDGAVMEGRDIGTVVFPDADHKFYFTASQAIRAKRRHRDLFRAGKRMPVQQVLKDIVKRDKTDYSRKEGPLKKAKDVIEMDTTSLTIEETVDKILHKIDRR